MATGHAATCVSSSELRAHERRLQHALPTLNSPGWEQRLQPLTVHTAGRRLVRARSDAGVALRRLDPGLLREALSRLLRNDWDRRYVVYLLAVIGAVPSTVAAERRVSEAVLVEQLRDAVDQLELTMEVENVAYASAGESEQERVRTVLARKRG